MHTPPNELSTFYNFLSYVVLQCRDTIFKTLKYSIKLIKFFVHLDHFIKVCVYAGKTSGSKDGRMFPIFAIEHFKNRASSFHLTITTSLWLHHV